MEMWPYPFGQFLVKLLSHPLWLLLLFGQLIFICRGHRDERDLTNGITFCLRDEKHIYVLNQDYFRITAIC